MDDLADLARSLRQLRRREARRRGDSELTYREIAAKTGWSRGIIGEYFAGKVLPPTDRFDVLSRLLGATPAEQGALATARDRIEEARRDGVHHAGRGAGTGPRNLPEPPKVSAEAILGWLKTLAVTPQRIPPGLPAPTAAPRDLLVHDLHSRAPEHVTDVQAREGLSRAYRQLSGEAARLFRLLGMHPGTDIAAPAVASLAGIPPERAQADLAELVRASLVVEHTPGRFALHDLRRAYATELSTVFDTDTDRQAAGRRVLDHYLHTAHRAAILLSSGDLIYPVVLAEAHAGVTPQTHPDREHALAWFTEEYAVLLAIICDAVRDGCDNHIWQLVSALATYLHRMPLGSEF